MSPIDLLEALAQKLALAGQHAVSVLLVALFDAYQGMFWWGPGLAGAALLMALNSLKREQKWTAIMWAVCTIPGLVTFIVHFSMPHLIYAFRGRELAWPAWHQYGLVGSFFAGAFASLIWLRSGIQKIDKLTDSVSVKSGLERTRKTDIRHIQDILPDEIGNYDPTKYFSKERGIFVGLDVKKEPIYIQHTKFCESHLLLCGMTRSGKGVAAQILGTQSIRQGELFVVLDPKLDNYMPHIFRAQAQGCGQPYVCLDLRQSAPPQINPFTESVEDNENLLLAAFSLAEKGSDADFYRVNDRRAALGAARLIVSMRQKMGRLPTPSELVQTEQAATWSKDAPNFFGYLLEMAELPAVNATAGGVSIADLAQSGGCLYVIGDMMNSRVVRMQRLLLLRLMQIARARISLGNSNGKIIRVFADEFTVHISRPFLVSLAASAGWRLCVMLAFQTLGDLANCPADLTPEGVKGSVWENCTLKLIYKIQDATTAKWLAESTGLIQVDDESRHVEKNIALSETIEGGRTLRQGESQLIDVNMFLGLARGCGVMFGASRLPSFCYTSFVAATQTEAAIVPSYHCNDRPDQPCSAAAMLTQFADETD